VLQPHPPIKDITVSEVFNAVHHRSYRKTESLERYDLIWTLPVILNASRITRGTVIMGRKTFESSAPVPNRTNIVISRQKTYWLLVVHSLDEALRKWKRVWSFVIGGGIGDAAAIDKADRLIYGRWCVPQCWYIFSDSLDLPNSFWRIAWRERHPFIYAPWTMINQISCLGFIFQLIGGSVIWLQRWREIQPSNNLVLWH